MIHQLVVEASALNAYAILCGSPDVLSRLLREAHPPPLAIVKRNHRDAVPFHVVWVLCLSSRRQLRKREQVRLQALLPDLAQASNWIREFRTQPRFIKDRSLLLTRVPEAQPFLFAAR